MSDKPIVKLYFDYKSPFAYLAFEPALAMAEELDVNIRWIPYIIRIKGKGERSIYSEWKVRYSYRDARRFANRRGGFSIRGPRKVYDSTPSLLGSLFAMRHGCFIDYSRQVFSRFFDHRLEIDQLDEICILFQELNQDTSGFREFAEEEGLELLDRAISEGEDDHVFGVPMFIYEGEQFWGADRIWLLRERFIERGPKRPE